MSHKKRLSTGFVVRSSAYPGQGTPIPHVPGGEQLVDTAADLSGGSSSGGGVSDARPVVVLVVVVGFIIWALSEVIG